MKTISLYEKLKKEISQHVGGDLDCNNFEKWIDLKRKGVSVTIEFDETGEHIHNIGVFQDIIQVVDQKKLF